MTSCDMLMHKETCGQADGKDGDDSGHGENENSEVEGLLIPTYGGEDNCQSSGRR